MDDTLRRIRLEEKYPRSALPAYLALAGLVALLGNRFLGFAEGGAAGLFVIFVGWFVLLRLFGAIRSREIKCIELIEDLLASDVTEMPRLKLIWRSVEKFLESEDGRR